MDNTYHVYTAGGISWLVLNLELWQRPGALSWAQRVVKAHPQHNVIVVTHSYLTAQGKISTKAEYGDTAPSVLARKLVKKYPNVRMVFSGHVGQAAHRVDKGVHGNRIDSFVVAMHSNTTNPMQLVRVDTKKNDAQVLGVRPADQHPLSEGHGPGEPRPVGSLTRPTAQPPCDLGNNRGPPGRKTS